MFSALRFVVSVGLVAALIYAVDLREMAAVLADALWWPVVVACLPLFVNRILTTWKWQMLLQSQGNTHGFGFLLRVVWVSNFFGHFLPSGVGGDGVRMWSVAQGVERGAEAASTVVVDRLAGAASLAFLAVLGVVWSTLLWGDSQALAILAGPLAAFIAGLVLVWTPFGIRLLERLMERAPGLPGASWLRDMLAAIRRFEDRPGLLVSVFLISVLVQVTRVMAVYFVTVAVHSPVSPVQAMVVIPPALFVAQLPVSIGGFGVREAVLVAFLGVAGMPLAPALGAALLSRLVATLSDVPGAWMYWARGLGREPGMS